MNDTPRTDAEVFLLFKTGDDEGVPAEFARKLERENAALRVELLEEARVNGKGSEREAKLLAEVAALRAEIDSLKSALEALAVSSIKRSDEP